MIHRNSTGAHRCQRSVMASTPSRQLGGDLLCGFRLGDVMISRGGVSWTEVAAELAGILHSVIITLVPSATAVCR